MAFITQVLLPKRDNLGRSFRKSLYRAAGHEPPPDEPEA